MGGRISYGSVGVYLTNSYLVLFEPASYDLGFIHTTNMERTDEISHYTSLPYDILHYICLASLDCPADDDEYSALFNLSLTDHRTREVSIPILFQHISFKSKWMDTSREYICLLINAVGRNNDILRAAK